MKEEFRTVKGFENYEVSNLGRVRNKKTKRFLKSTIDHIGYCRVVLRMNNKPKDFSIHRLVAFTFIPNPNNYPVVNHKDENKTNNNVNNLEWCTVGYNNNYGTRNKRVSNKLSKPIIQYNLKGDFIKEWCSGKKAAKELGLNYGAINNCCRGKSKTSYGYIWRYK